MKWLGKFPDSFLAEIGGQPDALRRAALALLDQRDTIEALRDAGRRAGSVVFTGMGASYDACYPAVNELAVHGVLALQIDAAELLHFRSQVLSPATVLVLVSQSGRSAEVVRLLDALDERPERPVVLSVTNGLENPLAERADLRLDTRAGAEEGPSTMTFVSSLVQLAAVAGALSERSAGGRGEVIRSNARALPPTRPPRPWRPCSTTRPWPRVSPTPRIRRPWSSWRGVPLARQPRWARSR